MSQSSAIAETDLDWLVGSVGKEEFLRSYWDQKSVFVPRGDTRYYAPVLAPYQIAEVANMAVRLSDRIRTRPLVELVGGHKSAGVVRLRNTIDTTAGMWRAYNSGATILVQVAQQYWPPLKKLCDALETDLRSPIDATLICTPRGSQAFGRHYDRLNALAIQLQGRKHWRLFGRAIVDPVQELPLLPFETAEMAHDRLAKWPTSDRAETTAAEVVTLEAGDFLYIPRGVYHEVWSEEEESAHITLAVRPVTYLDLMLAALARHAEAEPSLRKALPFRALNGASTDLPSKAAVLARGFAAAVDVDGAMSDIEQAYLRSRPPLERTVAFAIPADLSAKTTVCFVSADRPTVLYNRDQAELYYGDRLFRVPQKAGAALEFIAARDQFLLSEVPGLTFESVLTLVRRLVRANVLRVVTESELSLGGKSHDDEQVQ